MNGQPKTEVGAGGMAAPSTARATILEISLVLGLPTAVFLSASLFSPALGTGHVTFTDDRLLNTLAVEGLASALLLPYLWRRGWTPAAVGGAPHPLDALRGALVWVSSYAAYWFTYVVLFVATPSWVTTLQETRYVGSVSVPVAIAVAILNPLFEEFLWLGYTIPALAPRIGLRAACVASVALRVAVHAYQGPMALVGIAPMAVVFTSYYAQTRRLWPLVVAHVIGDAAGLAALRH